MLQGKKKREVEKNFNYMRYIFFLGDVSHYFFCHLVGVGWRACLRAWPNVTFPTSMSVCIYFSPLKLYHRIYFSPLNKKMHRPGGLKQRKRKLNWKLSLNGGSFSIPIPSTPPPSPNHTCTPLPFTLPTPFLPCTSSVHLTPFPSFTSSFTPLLHPLLHSLLHPCPAFTGLPLPNPNARDATEFA